MPARMLAIVVLIAVTIASAILGAAVDRGWVRAHPEASLLPDTAYHPLSSILRSPTDDDRKKARQQLAAELGLNAAQTARVDSILDAHAAEFRALREEIRPRVEDLTRAVRSDVESVLTSAQRLRYRALLGTQMLSDSARQEPR